MDTKKMTMAWLGGFLVMFVLGGIWHNFVMMDYNMAAYAGVNLPEEEFSLLYIAIGYLIISFMMSYMYPIGFGGGSAIKEGLRFGVMLGIFMSFSKAFIFAGAYKMPLDANLYDAVYHVAELAIGGIVIAKIYGLGGGNEASAETDSG